MDTILETMGSKLNDLLEKTYDAEKGYQKAAEHVEDSYLKGFFQRKAQQRYDFGHELKTEIRSLGQEVDKGDSLTSKAHRSWMDIKALFASDNEEAMLEEAIRGEKATINEYDQVLKETKLPPSTETVLRKQYNAIETGLSNIRTLEDLR